MNNFFLCKFNDAYKPILLITTVFYEGDESIGKSLYYDMDNGNILTRYFEISIKRGKKTETMIMQDSPNEYDLSETPYLHYKNNEMIMKKIPDKELLEKVKSKLLFTTSEIKKLNEYRFGSDFKKRIK